MKSFIQSPYFFFGFVLLAGIARYLILEYHGAGNAVEYFILNDSHGKKGALSAGPLIFSFFELLFISFIRKQWLLKPALLYWQAPSPMYC